MVHSHQPSLSIIMSSGQINSLVGKKASPRSVCVITSVSKCERARGRERKREEKSGILRWWWCYSVARFRDESEAILCEDSTHYGHFLDVYIKIAGIPTGRLIAVQEVFATRGKCCWLNYSSFVNINFRWKFFNFSSAIMKVCPTLITILYVIFRMYVVYTFFKEIIFIQV